MISDSDWKYVTQDYAQGKEGTVSVIDINGTKAILKQFKAAKSGEQTEQGSHLTTGGI